MKRTALLFILLVLITPNAQAFTDGSGWKLVAQMVKVISYMKKQLDAVNDQLKFLDQIEELQQKVQTTYEEVANNRLLELSRDISITLNNIQQDPRITIASLERQLRGIERELNRLDLSEDEKEILEQGKKLVKQEVVLQKLREISSQNVQKAAHDLGQRDADRITAESTATLARLAIEQKASEVDQQKAALEDKSVADMLVNSTSKAMSGMAKGRKNAFEALMETGQPK